MRWQHKIQESFTAKRASKDKQKKKLGLPFYKLENWQNSILDKGIPKLSKIKPLSRLSKIKFKKATSQKCQDQREEKKGKIGITSLRIEEHPEYIKLTFRWSGETRKVYHTPNLHSTLCSHLEKKCCSTAKGNQNYHNSNSPKIIQNRWTHVSSQFVKHDTRVTHQVCNKQTM